MLGEQSPNHGMDRCLIFWEAKGVDWKLSKKVDADLHDTQGLQYGEMGGDRDISS